VNTALLVLRLVPGILFIGHGLQKLVPAKYSPPLLHASGPRAAAGFFEQLGLRPGLPFVLAAGLAEVGGGFLIAAGFVTPLGTALLAAVMTVAVVAVHLRHGIWVAEGGFEFALLMLSSPTSSAPSDRAASRSTLGPGSATGPGSTGPQRTPHGRAQRSASALPPVC
jgi:putative oxidoreductase